MKVKVKADRNAVEFKNRRKNYRRNTGIREAPVANRHRLFLSGRSCYIVGSFRLPLQHFFFTYKGKRSVRS